MSHAFRSDYTVKFPKICPLQTKCPPPKFLHRYFSCMYTRRIERLLGMLLLFSLAPFSIVFVHMHTQNIITLFAGHCQGFHYSHWKRELTWGRPLLPLRFSLAHSVWPPPELHKTGTIQKHWNQATKMQKLSVYRVQGLIHIT